MKTINKEEIIRLNKEGKTNSEIRKELGYSLTTISKYLEESGLVNNSTNPKSVLERIKGLYLLRKTNSEIANELGISKTTARKYTNIYLKAETNSIKKKPIFNTDLHLTEEQLDLIYGSLLGDMSIDRHSKLCRLAISHGGQQEEYFDHKCNLLSNIIGKIVKKPRYDKRTNKEYIKLSARTLSHKIFNSLYNELYIDGVKQVTEKWLNKLTPRALAYWYMDDGSNSGVLATNCFSLKEVELIQRWFKSTYNIITTIELQKNQPVLYFTRSAKQIFYDLTNKYFLPSMQYKILNWNL